jgi:hypothetical protein
MMDNITKGREEQNQNRESSQSAPLPPFGATPDRGLVVEVAGRRAWAIAGAFVVVIDFDLSTGIDEISRTGPIVAGRTFTDGGSIFHHSFGCSCYT